MVKFEHILMNIKMYQNLPKYTIGYAMFNWNIASIAVAYGWKHPSGAEGMA